MILIGLYGHMYSQTALVSNLKALISIHSLFTATSQYTLKITCKNTCSHVYSHHLHAYTLYTHTLILTLSPNLTLTLTKH